jgi:hypothetical protein
LKEARRRNLKVSRDFLQVSKDVPSGIPSPDGMLRPQLQAREQQRAFYAFDPLHFDGQDLRELPLCEREILRQTRRTDDDPRILQ